MQARAIINIVSPISHQSGLVLNDILLPVLAPIIDSISTDIAGSQIIPPRCQYIGIAPKAVKIDTVNEVAIVQYKQLLHKSVRATANEYH